MYDVLARYGGEEFVIILPQTSGEEARIVAEKLRSAVEKAPFREGDRVYRVTASFGIAVLTPENERELDKKELIRRADKALYEAKNGGRNRVMAYGEKKGWFKRK